MTLDGFVSSSVEVAVISEEDLMDVRALARQGYTYAEIGRLVGRDWRTVKRYLESGAQPVYRRKRMPSKLDAMKPLIDQWLAAEPKLLSTRVHQDLVRDYGFEGGYDTVRRYVERTRPKPQRRSEVRFETAAGFQAQVDWSFEQPIRTSSGLELPLYCFHMVLGHSRDSFCALTGSQDLVTFWGCHRQAFAHFGGVPRELLYDRTKTVVREHVGREVSLEERIFHPEALASAHHYGFSMRLCQAYRAKTKGKVEHDVPYVRERLLRAHSFTSYEQANVAWRAWNDEVARRRVHGTHGEIVAERAQRDRAALLALPPTAYLVLERTTRVVARDGFFSFEGRRYHVPDAKPAERVELVLGPEELEVYSTLDGRRLARHARGRPALVLPDPVENSVSLAEVLQALPVTEVHQRPLSVYQEAIDG
ncbi:MAG: IS21 family transposase [Mycobacteriaceae bacterium]